MFEPIVSLENARAALSSRMQGFTDALSQCQKEWNNKLASAQMVLDGSARAHLWNQYWYYYARSIFNEDNGVRFFIDQLQRYIVVDERVIMRFKLFDEHLCARNYPTDHAVDWKLQIPLEGLPPCARLHYGYRMDITGTKVKDAFITLPKGSSFNEWVWQTSGEPIDIFGTVGFQQTLHQMGEPNQTVYKYDNYPLG